MVVQDGSEKLLAEAYVWSTEDDPDLHGDWDFEVKSISSIQVIQDH